MIPVHPDKFHGVEAFVSVGSVRLHMPGSRGEAELADIRTVTPVLPHYAVRLQKDWAGSDYISFGAVLLVAAYAAMTLGTAPIEKQP